MVWDLKKTYLIRKARRKRGQGGGGASPPPQFSGTKVFSHVKSENIKFS